MKIIKIISNLLVLMFSTIVFYSRFNFLRYFYYYLEETNQLPHDVLDGKLLANSPTQWLELLISFIVVCLAVFNLCTCLYDAFNVRKKTL